MFLYLLYLLVPVEKPNLMTIPEADNVVEAEEVKFVCSVRKGSLPITFKWYRDDNHRPVHTVTEKKDHATYSLPSASSVHSGTYYCEALNQGVEKVEKSNHIIVTGYTIKIPHKISLAQQQGSSRIFF